MRICLPSGIGDTAWALTKVQAILREAGEAQADLIVADNHPQRSREFLAAFDFIRSVEYAPIEIMRRPLTHPDHRWNYVPTQRGLFSCDWWLCPNDPLEQGIRLESWLPEYATNWNVQQHYRFQPHDLEFAADLRKRLGEYVVFYLGPEAGNTYAGHNRGGIWSVNDWVQLGRQVGTPIVVVGAEYDRSYSDQVLAAAHDAGSHWLDYVGRWEIGRTFAVVRQAKSVVSYQSGIGIGATFFRVPTAMWWRAAGDSLEARFKIWFSENMRHCWAPLDMLDSGRYRGMIYGRPDATPEVIAEWMRSL